MKLMLAFVLSPLKADETTKKKLQMRYDLSLQ